LAYLFIWTTAFVAKPSSIAVLTLTFSQYFLSGVMDGKFPPIHCHFYSFYTLICTFRLWTSRRTCQNDGYFCYSFVYVFCYTLTSLIYLFTVMLININSISVTGANRLNIIFVISKVLTILTVIIIGLVRIGQGLLLFSFKNKLDHLRGIAL